uniref:E3 ubiquitin-protein ligase Mdm2-like isoform X1 n=1 Tax=Myxine glutinosa TaxID=7769 RepID=UPI00358F46FC
MADSTFEPKTVGQRCFQRQDLVKPSPLLQRVLHLGGARGDVLSMQQVIDFLGQYIKNKHLFDKKQHHIVYCRGDLLEEVFGVQSFSIKEPRSSSNSVPALLSKHLSPVCRKSQMKDAEEASTVVKQGHCSSTEERSQEDSITSELSQVSESAACGSRASPPADSTMARQKRSRDVEQESKDESWVSSESSQKRSRRSLSETEAETEVPGWFVSALPRDSDCDSTASTEPASWQGYETVMVTDSSDDLWFLEKSDSDSDRFSVEYEVASLSSSEFGNAETDETTSDAETEAVYEVTVYNSETDSSCEGDSEIEFPKEDRWRCSKCHEVNLPLHRFCLRCWNPHKAWMPIAKQYDSHGVDVPDGACGKDQACTEADPAKIGKVKGLKAEEVVKEEEEEKFDGNEEGRGDDAGTSGLSSQSSFGSQDGTATVGLVKDSGRIPLDLGGSQNSCVICQLNPKSCTIVHGRTGHFVTCYPCAKRLKRLGHVCPVCRSPIQALIKTYL